MVSWAEFRGGLLALGGLFILVLAVIVVQPDLPGELLLQSLRFHILAGGVVLALVLVLAGARWRGLMLMLVVVAGGVQGANFLAEFQDRRVDHADAPLAQFRFLSFNVLADNPQGAALVEAIVADPPDVMLVMESPGVAPYMEQLEEVLPHRIGCTRPGLCDISLLSRFPFEVADIKLLQPLARERLVTGQIRVDGQVVTIVGVHLTKPYYDNIAGIELAVIDRHLRRIEGPLVLAGDFNSASWSEPLVRIGRQQQLAPGPVQPATWPVRLGWLGLPIDNVFTRGSAQIMTLEAGDNHGSNHRPLWAEIGLYGAD